MNRNRIAAVAMSATMIAAGGVVMAASPAQGRPNPDVLISPATPDQVWVQSFERSSADAPCIAPAWLETAWNDAWDPAEKAWTPTWEQWANGGKGGWTCTRSITWAHGSPEVWQRRFT